MLNKQEDIERYKDRLEMLSTNNEMLSNFSKRSFSALLIPMILTP